MSSKEVILDKQGISLIVLFIIGSSSVSVMGLQAEKDFWLATILAIFMALPMVFIYARLLYIFSGKDLFDILEICFGKLIGKGVIILLTSFFCYWTADVLVNFGYFINITSFDRTPQTVYLMMIILLCAWTVREGIETAGRIGVLLLLISLFLISLFVISLIPSMKISNIQPIFYKGVKPIILGAFDAFAFPFAQTFAFTAVFSSLNEKKSPYKIYINGLLLGGFVLVITSMATIMVLGAYIAEIKLYPTYTTLRRLRVGFLQRVEVLLATVFVLGGFVKAYILLLCTCKGVTKIFRFKDFRFIVIPISLLVLNLSYFLYESVLYMNEFTKSTWVYILSSIEVILFVIIWITAEIKNQVKKKVE